MRVRLFIFGLAAIVLGGCAAVSPGLESTVDPPPLTLQGIEPAPPPQKPGTKITGKVGDGPGTLELTDKDGNKAFAHADKDGNVDGFVAKEGFNAVTAMLELNDGSKHAWNLNNDKWEPELLATGGSTSRRTDLVSRLFDTEIIIQGGYSWTNSVHLSSMGAPPGGPAFLNGSGESQASGFSTNFMLRHHFDRYMPILHDSRPFVYLQGSTFSNFAVTGNVGGSGTGLDRALQQRHINYG